MTVAVTPPPAWAQRAGRPVFSMAAAVIVLVALWLRLDLALTRPLWLDEIFTGAVSQGSLHDILHIWLSADVHPPLHYVLTHGWVALAGQSDFALRVPSLLASSATILLGARAMARRYGHDAGWIAAITLAVPAGAIYYASEARSYALQMLLALALMLAHRALRTQWHLRRWVLLVLLTVLLCLTHYFGFLFALCIWVILLSDAWMARRLRQWGLAALVSAAMLAPWLAWHLPYMLSKTGGNFWIPPLGFAQSLLALAVSVWSDPVFALSFGVTAAAVWAMLHRREGGTAAGVDDFPWRGYAISLCGVVTGLALMSLSSPLVVPRYVLLFLPMTCLIAARALLLLPPLLARGAALGLGALVLMLGQTVRIYEAPDRLAWRAASHWLAAQHPDQLLFAFDDGAGVHIGTENLSRLGAFFLRRSGNDVPVTARAATPAAPQLSTDLPPGRRIAVLLVVGQLVGTDARGRWINRGWMGALRREYPDHRCRPAPVEGPQACIFVTHNAAGAVR